MGMVRVCADHSGMTADEIITLEVASWPGVSAGSGSRGEFSFKVGAREIGHLHGDRVAHFGFPKGVWQELYDAGRIDYHPVFPNKKGWGARRIDDAADVDDVIALMRVNYDRVVAAHGVPV
jgi:luciferase-like monooxygenase